MLSNFLRITEACRDVSHKERLHIKYEYLPSAVYFIHMQDRLPEVRYDQIAIVEFLMKKN
jgi:hypothetical protein